MNIKRKIDFKFDIELLESLLKEKGVAPYPENINILIDSLLDNASDKLLVNNSNVIKTTIEGIDSRFYEKDYTLTCPLCGAKTLEHKELDEETHVWVCSECPAILLEYWGDKDRRVINNYLK